MKRRKRCHILLLQKIGIEKGIQQGIRQGLLEAIELGLKLKFGTK